MNQVIIAYHAVARGEIALSPELADYQLYRARRRSSAGRPAPAMRWPTGCAARGIEPQFMELPPRQARPTEVDVD